MKLKVRQVFSTYILAATSFQTATNEKNQSCLTIELPNIQKLDLSIDIRDVSQVTKALKSQEDSVNFHEHCESILLLVLLMRLRSGCLNELCLSGLFFKQLFQQALLMQFVRLLSAAMGTIVD